MWFISYPLVDMQKKSGQLHSFHPSIHPSILPSNLQDWVVVRFHLVSRWVDESVRIHPFSIQPTLIARQNPTIIHLLSYLPTYLPTYLLHVSFTGEVTKKKPDVNSVSIHPQLNLNRLTSILWCTHGLLVHSWLKPFVLQMCTFIIIQMYLVTLPQYHQVGYFWFQIHQTIQCFDVYKQ